MSSCIQCEKNPRNGESLFCSPACKTAYSINPPESISCGVCDAQTDGVAAAEAQGWKHLEMDVEGYSWNYLGLCPDCQKEEVTR